MVEHISCKIICNNIYLVSAYCWWLLNSGGDLWLLYLLLNVLIHLVWYHVSLHFHLLSLHTRPFPSYWGMASSWVRQVGKCCLLYVTPCTCASTTVRERERYAVCEGCRNNSLGGVMWDSVPEEGLLHVKSRSTDVKCSSGVYVTLIKWTVCGSVKDNLLFAWWVWEKPWKTCQDSESSSRDLNWRLCKYMAEVWLMDYGICLEYG
jgi:hypothetical protein